jgi:Protein kinase domain
MPLPPGTHLGRYEILALIGTGGMGEVYRSLDPRMERTVAIKVSAEQFTERFDLEVRAVAALNHPNICQIYDVGQNYLVMELIEGESPVGPLPLEKVLDYARQIADALSAAHEKGVVHRDLKPEKHQGAAERAGEGAGLRAGEDDGEGFWRMECLRWRGESVGCGDVGAGELDPGGGGDRDAAVYEPGAGAGASRYGR